VTSAHPSDGSVVEDLGALLAVSIRRAPVLWSIAGFAAAATPLWTGLSVGLPWVVIAATILFRVAWLPPAMVRGGSARFLVLAGGVGLGITRVREPVDTAWHAFEGVGLALTVLVAIAAARSLRRPAAADENSLARLLASARARPSVALLSVLLFADPVFTWARDAAWAADTWIVESDLVGGAWALSGADTVTQDAATWLLLALVLVRSRARRPLQMLLVGLLATWLFWQVVGRVSIAVTPPASPRDWVPVSAEWLVVAVVLVPLAWLVRAVRDGTGGALVLPLTALAYAFLWVSVDLAITWARARGERGADLGTFVASLVLSVGHLSLLVAALTSYVRGRTLVVLAGVYGAATAAFAGSHWEATEAGLLAAPVAAARWAWTAVWLLVVRDVRRLDGVGARRVEELRDEDFPVSSEEAEASV
jgi:hypothetical protein